MEEEKKETAGEGNQACCGCKCGCGRGSKFLWGAIFGLLLAGSGFGLYMAGKCSGKICPVGGAAAVQVQK